MALDKDDIKQLIAILQKGLADDTIDNDDDEESSTAEIEIKPKSKAKEPKIKKNTKETNRKNLFDKMSEFRMHKEDVEIDKKLSKHPPTQRSRSFNKIDVKCRVCGREENVNPILVESKERYKCNKCSRSSG